MKPYRGPPATLGSTAAAQARIVVWCRDWPHQAEPDPAELARRYGADTPIPGGWFASGTSGQAKADLAARFARARTVSVGRIMTAPMMILISEADDWTPADRYREIIAKARPDGAPIALTVYPGAYHAFDVAWLQPGRSALGHWLEYNEPAAKDAEKRRAHSSTPISPTHLPASRRQSDPVGRPKGSDPLLSTLCRHRKGKPPNVQELPLPASPSPA
jgi:Dienelactone hydrolase family